MNWWVRHHGRPATGAGTPSAEAQGSASEAERASLDVNALTGRLDEAARRLEDTRRRNHFGDAVARSFMRRT